MHETFIVQWDSLMQVFIRPKVHFTLFAIKQLLEMPLIVL